MYKNIKTRQKAVKWGVQVPLYYFGMVPDIIKATGEAFVKSLAADSAKQIKRNIIRQTYNHKPLNLNYKHWKKKKGYDTRILIRTRFFLDNIGSFKEHEKNAIVYRVGVKDLQYPNKKKLQTIARYLEYGTSKMPARPVFRPMSREISAHIHSHVLRLVNSLNINLKKKLPYVSIDQLLSRALRQGDMEVVPHRRVVIRGMLKRRHIT